MVVALGYLRHSIQLLLPQIIIPQLGSHNSPFPSTMAVHRDYPGLKAEVIVSGEALPEYQDKEGEVAPKEYTTYVQASSDVLFAIRYTIPSTIFAKHSVQAVIKLDGAEMRSNLFRKTNHRHTGYTVTYDMSAAHVDGIDLGQRFRFSDVQIGEFSNVTIHTEY
jgi:hypothetical protein